ncbi:nuclease-related domain-containing DEAD/DEAH box helicase [Campylobacter armoricus]|uniref:nuclease-related domain-containing DEAD/DEAH box helicase n=1 Tax=Campylobacter armoricus TaxID=2505970 RepID=UPI0011171FEE|nr:NERD domain-containing protein [Campylobacter armoricus]
MSKEQYKLFTKGEEYISNMLYNGLSRDYEIYEQPKINYKNKLYIPDFIIYHENKGIFIIEVKDWKLENFGFTENNNCKNKFINNKIYPEIVYKNNKKIKNPIQQINEYKNIILNFLKNNFVPIYEILYFHNATTKDILEKIDNKDIKIFGKNNANELFNFITFYIRCKNYYTCDNFRKLFFKNIHKVEHGKNITLTNQQKYYIEDKPNTWNRIKGVAGSGKSLIIAHRAANIASKGKKVLVICYNKTLKQYLKAQINDVRKEFDWNLIDIDHFHGLLFNFIKNSDISLQYTKSFENTEKEALENANYILQSEDFSNSRYYDAILIDEAQDFKQKWFDFLLYFLKDNGQVMVVADDKQNIYDREISWIGNMNNKGYKFKGQWGKLNINIRQYNFPEILIEAYRFYVFYLSGYLIKSNKNFGETLEPPIINTQNTDSSLIRELYWCNIEKNNYTEIVFRAYNFLLKHNSPKNIVILTSNHEEVDIIKKYFKEKNVSVEDMIDNKEYFSFTSDNVKISTIKSFKGMQLQCVIFLTSTTKTELSDFETYIALTRPSYTCIVLNRIPEYELFGKEWEKYNKINFI